MKILSDGSIEGQTFSGAKYKGEYPSPLYGKETYEEFYKRVRKCVKEGFHLGDLCFSSWQDYCYGSPAGGGQYVSNYIIGKVPEHAWVNHDQSSDNNDDE